MTKRQQQIAAFVGKHARVLIADANRELDPQPVGYTVMLHIVCFLPHRPHHGQRWPETLDLLVMKLPDGLRWREDDPSFYNRKGRTAPAWRAFIC